MEAKAQEKPASLFDNLSDVGKNLLSPEGAKKFAAWYIDTSEKLAKSMLDYQASANEWAKSTPLAPIFEAQQDLSEKFVKRSAEVARKIFQIEESSSSSN